MKKGLTKKKLRNGMTLLYLPTNSDSVTVQVMVHVGSNNESAKQAGLAHFIEHMVFEGTPKRPSSRLVASEIEEVGGEFNAYTSAVRTCFYAKVLSKHVKRAVNVLADILQHPLLRGEDIKRQPAIIEKEIDMINDEPRLYQWLLFEKTLFKKHPVRNPTYGNKKTINTFTQKNISSFYQKYYTPKNMTISVAGKVPNIQKIIEQAFHFSGGKRHTTPCPKEPVQKKETRKEKRNIGNSYLVIGYKTVPRAHKDSYVLDVIDAILGKGQSGWLFDEVRSVHGLAYDVGSQHEAETDHGFFAAYASVEKKNLEKAKKLILEQFAKINEASDKDIKDAKDYIEGSFLLDHEDTQRMADSLLFWEHIKDGGELFAYLKKVKQVSKSDVRRVAKKYLNAKCTITVVEGR